jgi:hypothetical protein
MLLITSRHQQKLLRVSFIKLKRELEEKQLLL